MLNHIGTREIETERLILRRFAMDDAEPMFRNWANDAEVTRYLTWAPHGKLENTAALLTMWTREYEEETRYRWAIEPKARGEAVGCIDVVSAANAFFACEIGYCAARDMWGQGIMTEALTAVIRYLFEEVGYNRIQAKHHVLNPASGRVMQKSGMAFEGVLRQLIYREGLGFCDCAMYAILKEDWAGRQACINPHHDGGEGDGCADEAGGLIVQNGLNGFIRPPMASLPEKASGGDAHSVEPPRQCWRLENEE